MIQKKLSQTKLVGIAANYTQVSISKRVLLWRISYRNDTYCRDDTVRLIVRTQPQPLHTDGRT